MIDSSSAINLMDLLMPTIKMNFEYNNSDNLPIFAISAIELAGRINMRYSGIEDQKFF